MGASGSVSYMFDKKGVIVFAGEDADAIFEQLLEADVDVEDVEAEDGTITVYTEPTDLHKALEALRANGQEEFQVTELEMIPQTEVTLEGDCCLDLLAHPTSKTQSIVMNSILMTFILFQIQHLILFLPCHYLRMLIYDTYRELSHNVQ